MKKLLVFSMFAILLTSCNDSQQEAATNAPAEILPMCKEIELETEMDRAISYSTRFDRLLIAGLMDLITSKTLAVCHEIQTASPCLQKISHTMWDKDPKDGNIPPLVGDVTIVGGGPFDRCEIPASLLPDEDFFPIGFCVTTYRAPFDILIPLYSETLKPKLIQDKRSIILDSGIVIGDIDQTISNHTPFLREFYRKHLEAMQITGGDSAYFTGDIRFRMRLNGTGRIENIWILSSSTNYPKFDRELRDSIALWLFPTYREDKEKSVVSFWLTFEKTQYPKGFVETSTMIKKWK